MIDNRQLPPNNPTEPWQNLTGKDSHRTVAGRIAGVLAWGTVGVMSCAIALTVGFRFGQQWQAAEDQTLLDAAYAERDATVIHASDLVQQLVAAQERTASAMERLAPPGTNEDVKWGGR